MHMLLAINASTLDFLVFLYLILFKTPRYYILSSLGCFCMSALEHYISSSSECNISFLFLFLTCNLTICSWSLGSGWPLPLLGNNPLFRTELIPIYDCRIYFLRLSHRLIPLNMFKGIA